MKALARAFWLVVQTAWGCALLPWLVLTRRGCPLILTHHQDRDGHGRDRQLGPLLDALGSRCVEVALVPARANATFARLRPGSRPPLPYAMLITLGRLLSPFVRDPRARVAGWLLAALRPSVVFLIDESGSGQPFVRAARTKRIRTVGIQHGDFAPGNAQYDGTRAHDVVAADVLCVWSTWFQARLLAVSTIYTSANTRVTGRLRDPAPPLLPREASVLRVLVVGEAGADFAPTVAPYLAALRAAGDLRVEVLPHPASGARGRDLALALADCDVAVGFRSSALLEALWHRKPVVVVGPEANAHACVAAGLAPSCTQPGALAAACRAAADDVEKVDRARAVVWGGAPNDAVEAILAAGDAATPRP